MTILDDFAASQQDKSANTVKAYTGDVSAFFEQYGMPNEDNVRQYRDAMLDEYAPSTINRKFASLRVFCEWAVEQGRLESDPTRHLHHVGEVQRAPKWLDKREKNALLDTVEAEGKPRDVALITFMLNTGLRVSEVSKLSPEDVKDGGIVVRGKGDKQRWVPLNDQAREALEHYPLPFDSQRGEHLGRRGIYYLIKTYAKKAGLLNVSPHTLRHTFAKNLMDSGVSIDRVAMLLGHSNIETTKVYTTPSDRDLQEAVNML